MSVFEKGLSWTLYKIQEADFMGFVDYVPYTKGNSSVYSPRLLSLLMQVCGYIDGLFKEMAEYDALGNIPGVQSMSTHMKKSERVNISDYREAFEGVYGLSSNNDAKFAAKLGWVRPREVLEMKPFATWKDSSDPPSWWTDYNAVKHEWPSALEKANLENVLQALAGAFLLNAVHLPSIETLRMEGVLRYFLETMRGEVFYDDHILKDDEYFYQEFNKARTAAESNHRCFLNTDHIIETPLFTYKFLQR